uniref:Uncharacterized protein n=1 Tax=Anguilla anguilla TaxID=7936 RepID=A0A0E9R3C2_ANGAN
MPCYFILLIIYLFRMEANCNSLSTEQTAMVGKSKLNFKLLLSII